MENKIEEKLRAYLKKIIIERETEKIVEEIQNIRINNDFEKGYLDFIIGLIKHIKKESSSFQRFSLFKKILEKEDLEELRKISGVNFYDDLWLIGFKTALKEVLELLLPNSNANEEGSY